MMKGKVEINLWWKHNRTIEEQVLLDLFFFDTLKQTLRNAIDNDPPEWTQEKLEIADICEFLWDGEYSESYQDRQEYQRFTIWAYHHLSPFFDREGKISQLQIWPQKQLNNKRCCKWQK